MGEKPYQCPEHPDAKIVESWDEHTHLWSGRPRGNGWRDNYKYECFECSRELSPPKNGGQG